MYLFKKSIQRPKKRKNFIQTLLQGDHFCRLKGTHQPSLDCLSDEQVLPILMHLDVATLLHCSRYLHRTYNVTSKSALFTVLSPFSLFILN